MIQTHREYIHVDANYNGYKLALEGVPQMHTDGPSSTKKKTRLVSDRPALPLGDNNVPTTDYLELVH